MPGVYPRFAEFALALVRNARHVRDAIEYAKATGFPPSRVQALEELVRSGGAAAGGGGSGGWRRLPPAPPLPFSAFETEGRPLFVGLHIRHG